MLSDSNDMWFRQRPLTQARMPSMRPHPLNPRAPAVPAEAAAAAAPTVAAPRPAALPPARAGGFHESSYELNSGLEISESEWPPDVTVPAALGDR